MKAYPIELRTRIYNFSLTHTIHATAKHFHVSPNTVFTLKKLYNETGSLEPRKSDYHHEHIITPECELYIQYRVVKQPDITLGDLCADCQQMYGVNPSISTMSNMLKKLGFTSKRKSFSEPKKKYQSDTRENAKI